MSTCTDPQLPSINPRHDLPSPPLQLNLTPPPPHPHPLCPTDEIFPYLVMVASVISVAVHFACQLNQQMRALLRHSVTELRSAVIVLGHWLLHAYGIVAVTQLSRPLLHSLMLLLVPFPTVFYIVTVKFTDPARTVAT